MSTPVTGAHPSPPPPEGNRSYLVTLLLACFFGMFGADRLYLGKTKSAFVKFITLGGLGYWWIIDLLLTLFGGQRDVSGLRLAGYDRYKKRVWKVVGIAFGAILAISTLPSTMTAAFDSTGPTKLGWIVIGAVGLSVVVIALILVLRHRTTRPVQAGGAHDSDPLPPPIGVHVTDLLVLRPFYFQAVAAHPSAGPIAEQIDLLVVNVVELFRRLKSKAGRSQQRRALAEYDENLGKLVDALGPDYGLDLLTKPQLWDDPDQHLADIHAALQAVESQLVDNIKQVNARKRLVFDAKVDRLMAPRALGG